MDRLYATSGYISWYYRKKFGIYLPLDLSNKYKRSAKSSKESDHLHEHPGSNNSVVDSLVGPTIGCSSSKLVSVVAVQIHEKLDKEGESEDISVSDNEE